MTPRRSPHGFTLIELLIVISIIGILAGMGITVYPMVMKTAQRATTKTTIQNLETALTMYKSDFGVYPDDSTPEAVMNALTGYKNDPKTRDQEFKGNPDWNGPYFDGDAKSFEFGERNRALLDPWLSKFQFNLSQPVHNPDKYDIWSPGPNRKDEKGEGDDISNWK